MSKLIYFIYVFSLLFMISCTKKDNPIQEKPSEDFVHSYDLRYYRDWKISTTPLKFPESNLINDLRYGFNRAKISWYVIDPTVFYDNTSSLRPPNITNDEISNHYVRNVLKQEVFPEQDPPNGTPVNIGVFNINYFPKERGPNNYDCTSTSYSSGLDEEGKLINPETRWGGIMRKIEQTGFEYNFIEFWLMDPFVYNSDISGKLYLNIGLINEDILSDGKHANEASLNLQDTSVYDTTAWGIINETYSWQYKFTNGNEQDYGLNGFNNEQERVFFNEYLNKIQSICKPEVFNTIYNDPSGDDYHFFMGDDYDQNIQFSSIIERYKKFTGTEGNSIQSVLFPSLNVFHPYTHKASDENLGEDMKMNLQDAYFEYKIIINKNNFKIGSNYIDDIKQATDIHLPNGETGTILWYHFKIPFEDYTEKYGNITLNSEFKAMRVYLTNFDQTVILRFASLCLSE